MVQYRGFTIEFRPSAVCVEAVAKNGKGGAISGLSTYGTTQDDARRKLQNRIDAMLAEAHSYTD